MFNWALITNRNKKVPLKMLKLRNHHGCQTSATKQVNARIVASGVLCSMKYKWTIQYMDVLHELS